jgi:hypothetical protein
VIVSPNLIMFDRHPMRCIMLRLVPFQRVVLYRAFGVFHINFDIRMRVGPLKFRDGSLQSQGRV